MNSSQTPVAAGQQPGKTTTSQPSLLFFYSPTSGRSRRADAFLAQVLQRRSNHHTFRLVRIDANKRPDLLERLQISEIPTLLVVEDGRVRARLSKPTGSNQINRFLSPWLK
jgi:thioredoxin-like negative regulator of GroEL